MRCAVDLSQRLSVFLDAGLISTVPTPWQVKQAEAEMALFVISADVTDEPRYRGAPLGNPVIRQPIILAHIGLDHLRVGTGIGADLISVCRHLHFTYHRGMPAWDLQVIQTFDDGLAVMRETTVALVENKTPEAKRLNRWIGRILPDPGRYHRRFLGEEGWIAQAERLQYPKTDDLPLPDEYCTLVGFMNHAAAAYPETAPGWRKPGVLAWCATRRIRDGRRMGWFSPMSYDR